MDQELVKAMANLDEQAVLQRVKMLLATEDMFSIQAMLNLGIKQVGEQFEEGEYFLADLVVSGMIYRSAMDLFRSAVPGTNTNYLGKVVIGVAENDIHDIGKDIICDVLRVEGFEVIDLGVDVSSATFVEAVRTHRPDIVAMSGVMRPSLDSFRHTIQALCEAGLRDQVAVVIGGNCITTHCAEELGADAEAVNPADTVRFCKDVMEKKRNGKK